MRLALQIVFTPIVFVVMFGGFLDFLTGGWLFRKLNIGYARRRK